MSTTIVYRARCIIDEEDSAGSQVLVQAASQDNNLRPMEGSHRDAAGKKMHTFRRLSTHNLEEAAEYFEGLARDYDGQGIREGAIEGDSGLMNGPRAYSLWANRFARATGIPLREPRLDHVFWGGLPPYLFTKPHPRMELKKGDPITLDEAKKLIDGSHTIRVLVTTSGTYASGERELRLGFLSNGNPCVYAPGARRKGYMLTGPVKAAHTYDSWANRPGIEHAQDVISTVTQRDEDPTGFYVSGHADGKFGYLARRGGQQMYEWSASPQHYEPLAGFKSQADAQRAIDIINKVLPDAGAKMLTAAELPAGYFPEGKHPAPPLAATALPEIPRVPKTASAVEAGRTQQAQLL